MTAANKTFDRVTAAKAQRDYCHTQEVPCFAPANGICTHCGYSIYRVISVEEAGSSRITRCPICGHTFVD